MTITIKQGNNPPVLFTVEAVDLTGFTIELVVKWADDQRIYGLGTGLSLQVTGTGPTLASIVTWAMPLADSRLMPVGRLTRYALEWRSPANVQQSADGWIEVTESVNRD